MNMLYNAKSAADTDCRARAERPFAWCWLLTFFMLTLSSDACTILDAVSCELSARISVCSEYIKCWWGCADHCCHHYCVLCTTLAFDAHMQSHDIDNTCRFMNKLMAATHLSFHVLPILSPCYAASLSMLSAVT